MNKFSYKNDLTIDNIVLFLNGLNEECPISDILSDPRMLSLTNYKTINYKNIYDKLLEYFYNELTTVEIVDESDGKYHGAMVHINESIRGKWLSDIHMIDFHSIYPAIICKLFKLGKLKFNIIELGDVYCFLVQNKGYIKKHKHLTKISNALLNGIINSFYGIIVTSYILGYECNDRNIMVDYTQEIFKSLTKNEDIIYIDISVIYTKRLSTDIINMIEELDLVYNIKRIKKGYFIYKQKYLTISDNDGVRAIGIEYDTERGIRRMARHNPKLHSEIKSQERVLKIDRIKKRIKVEH